MPISLDLRENGYVMYIQVTDPWNVAEMTVLYPRQKEYLDNAPHKLHTFLDMAQVKHPPTSVLSARVNAPSITHNNSGLLILVSDSNLIRALADTGFRVARFPRAHFFKTLEEAWAFLRNEINIEEQSKPV